MEDKDSWSMWGWAVLIEHIDLNLKPIKSPLVFLLVQYFLLLFDLKFRICKRAWMKDKKGDKKGEDNWCGDEHIDLYL